MLTQVNTSKKRRPSWCLYDHVLSQTFYSINYYRRQIRSDPTSLRHQWRHQRHAARPPSLAGVNHETCSTTECYSFVVRCLDVHAEHSESTRMHLTCTHTRFASLNCSTRATRVAANIRFYITLHACGSRRASSVAIYRLQKHLHAPSVTYQRLSHS